MFRGYGKPRRQSVRVGSTRPYIGHGYIPNMSTDLYGYTNPIGKILEVLSIFGQLSP